MKLVLNAQGRKEFMMAEENKAAETQKPATPTAQTEQKADAVDAMEQATKESLDSMKKDEPNSKVNQVVDEAENKLESMYADFRKWLSENANPEAIKEKTEELRKGTVKILNETKEEVGKVTSSPEFKETVAAGGKFFGGIGSMISEGFKYGYDKLMAIPEVKEAADKVDEGVDKLRENKFLKQSSETIAKGVEDLSSSVSNGLKSFFSADEKKPAEAPKADDEKK